MTIDVIIALGTTIGIAVAFSLAMFAAAALNGRGKKRVARVAIPTDHPDVPSDARELVLR
jgi:ABC-type phosphate/phosphonate transport system permease subunit